MAFRTIEVVLAGNDTSLRRVLLRSTAEIKSFGKEADNVGSAVEKSSSLMTSAFAASGLAVAAGVAYAVKSAADFEAEMRNVNSITHMSEAQFAATSQAVLDLSKNLPQSATTLAKGLYEIASSGFYGADGLKVLEVSAKAASAGLTTTDNAAQAITAVLNAYGLSAADAADVSDVLFQTVNLGVIHFEELRGVIGDTVGLAAAAKVDIGQVGAAIATMTLAGISGAEAGTSLNRVFQSLLKPSETLKFALNSLGYESGLQALQSDGLRGVMDKLRGVVGSNAEAWIQLFPEIRAARGAMALASAEGRNYARTSAEIEDRNKRQGATAAALKEQMKSLSAQFGLFVNRLNAAAIEGATHLLPTLIDILHGIEDLSKDGVPKLEEGLRLLSPFFEGLVETGKNVVDITGQLVDEFGPLGEVLAGLAAGGAITGLNGLASTLSAVTGLLRDNEEIVKLLAIAYGVKLAGSVISAAAAFVSAGFESIALKLFDMAGAADAGAAKMLTLRGAIAGISGGLAVFGILGIVDALQSASEAADKLDQKLTKGADTSTLAGTNALLDKIDQANKELTSTGQGLDIWEGLADLLPGVDTGFFKTNESLKRLKETAADAAAKNLNLSENINTVRNATGATQWQVEELAKSLKIDLTKGFDESKGARESLIQNWRDIVLVARGGGVAMQEAATQSIEQLQALKAESDDIADKVGKAFAGATSIIANFKEGADLGDFLKTTQADAQRFIDQTQDAARRGLDPILIQELLQSGPERAAPFLAAIAADHSGRLIEQANETNRTLSKMSGDAIELARVTQRAINATNVEMAGDYEKAMDILRAKAELGGAATAQAVADKLGIGVGEVKRVGDEYVIVFAAGVDQMAGVGGAAGANTSQALVDQLASKFQPAGEVVANYSEIIKGGLNPILAGIGASTIEQIRHDTGNIIPQAEGGFLPREATFARGTRIQWAEPETEGEWFIPAAKSKAGRSVSILGDAAKHFGLALVSRYASGGFHGPDDVPIPPDMGAYGNWVGYTGEAVTRREYDVVRQFIADHPERTGGDGGAIGSGWQAITAFLDSRSEPYTVTSTTGGNHVAGSLHYQGKAVDLVSGNMMHLFDTLLSIAASLQELFYDPAGRSVKNGAIVDWTVGGHSDHVHAATFDAGGVLKPGVNLIYNGTGATEALVPAKGYADDKSTRHSATRQERVRSIEIDYERLARAVASALNGQPVQVASESSLVIDGRSFGKVVSKTLHSRQVARS